MGRRKFRISRSGFISGGTTLFIFLIAFPWIWRGPGNRFYDSALHSFALRSGIERIQREMTETSRALLEGEDGDMIRTLFEKEATPSEYFNSVLDEIDRRAFSEDFRLRSLALTPAEPAGAMKKVAFEMETDTPYHTLGSFLHWMEEAYPIFHVDRIGVSPSPGAAGVRASIGGAMYLPNGGGGEEE